MTQQDRQLFNELTKDRTDSARMLEKASMRGIQRSVVEKYTDHAHFIYELLQNADDAQATEARFILEPSRLIFAHNGTRQFSVSDPATEDEDLEAGCLGDINAITSIANSNKTEVAVGKFGVGFKAVFQYTSTPHIYTDDCSFQIERFIVPRLLDDDCPAREKGETLFIFPFDHPERTAASAFDDIYSKLSGLTFPLLFLPNLKTIEYTVGGRAGSYGKRIVETRRFGEDVAEHVSLTQWRDGEPHKDDLWLFSRTCDDRLKYSVGFFLDDDGHLRPVSMPAFCFFPTKVATQLKFIIHAPFQLTDSREGIRANSTHNRRMIQLLADLASRSFVHLRDIGEQQSKRLIDSSVIEIIPYDASVFDDLDARDNVSFQPFYEAIHHVFSTETILPTKDGYTNTQCACWASVPPLTQLFSDKQLSKICGDKETYWVFRSIGRDDTLRYSRTLAGYIDSLVRTNLNEDAIINGRHKDYYREKGVRRELESVQGITPIFIELQGSHWLNRFYKWISETKRRRDSIRKKPIFLNQSRRAAAAYDAEDRLALFLPSKVNAGFHTVYPDLMKQDHAKELLRELGVTTPSLVDQIYHGVLPEYDRGDHGEVEYEDEAERAEHFKLIFEYYRKCANDELDSYIGRIKDYAFLQYVTEADPDVYYGTASSMYLPTKRLQTFFKNKGTTRFVRYEKYADLIDKEHHRDLQNFLLALGVRQYPEVETATRNTERQQTEEHSLKGLLDFVERIAVSKDAEASVFLWSMLCDLADKGVLSEDIMRQTVRTRKGRSKKWDVQYTASKSAKALRQRPWLISADGIFLSAQNLSTETLSSQYDLDLDGADKLLALLQISESSMEERRRAEANLTPEQRSDIAFAKKLKAMGISALDAPAFLAWKEKQERKKAQGEAPGDAQDAQRQATQQRESGTAAASAGKNSGTQSTDEDEELGAQHKVTKRIVRDIARRTRSNPAATTVEAPVDRQDDQDDKDELIPRSIDYNAYIESAKQRSADEIDRLAYAQMVLERAQKSKKYSFGWFNALLELEHIQAADTSMRSREVSISFAEVSREEGTQRTLVLRQPSRSIPQFVEDLTDMTLVLHMGKSRKNVTVEVANIQSYTLRVKLRNGTGLDEIDWSAVNSATLDAKSPAFLLEALREEFAALGYEDDFDMQENLPENIEFVFGPPGTGKTTFLAQEVLTPLMAKEKECRVLVLAPTNKAADVLVRRIQEAQGNECEDWLIRFGVTGDEQIEQSPIYKEKTYDILSAPKSVTVTTMARFPYDYFMSGGHRRFLRGIKWDYIVIDEASMISIANIVYPLYKKTPQKFIIAGDPFQIEPIASVNEWRNENIYTLVHLDSFANPETIPHAFKVHQLTTQYRSIPEIGQVFSELAYDGILTHHRSTREQRQLNLSHAEGVPTGPLNIIKFPVSQYESIYRPKRLQYSSPYQVYSALFVHEYVSYFAKLIAEANPGQSFRIGVIAPYRAQADLIDKLHTTSEIPRSVEVQVGTIHEFQGDECDIVFAVLNAPPNITASPNMFVNKRNIINVAISRARDYLFLVMPDDDTENVDDLRMIKRVEELIKRSGKWTETKSHDLEQLMFNDPLHLESNAFSTSHQSVNVYGLPEKIYEVRMEDNTLDVQVHAADVKARAGKRTRVQSEVAEEKQTPAEPLRAASGTPRTRPQADKHPSPERINEGAERRVNVRGEFRGTYRMILYSGTLDKDTKGSTEVMYIPQKVDGKVRTHVVSVDLGEKVIYVPQRYFDAHEELKGVRSVQLRRVR